MSTILKINILCLSFVFILVGCGSSSTDPSDESAGNFYFTPDNITISKDEQTDVKLEILELTEPIFGLSFQITFDSTVISFSDSMEIEAGGFFRNDPISFVKVENSTFYMAITQSQGQNPVSGSGVICTFPVSGKDAGSCKIEIVKDEVHFYDSGGNEIEIDDLGSESLKVVVR